MSGYAIRQSFNAIGIPEIVFRTCSASFQCCPQKLGAIFMKSSMGRGRGRDWGSEKNRYKPLHAGKFYVANVKPKERRR